MSIIRVCSSCFDDKDLRRWVRDANGPRGCDACGGFDSPTCKLDDICDYIQRCLKQYWGSAVEQLPYESAEGGYIGTTWNTYELLFDEAGLYLPRDRNNNLLIALLNTIGDDAWCEFDWLTLDEDIALQLSWERFCDTVKYKRRFFFHSTGTDDRDSYTPASLLHRIAQISQSMGLINEIAPSTKLWRARTDIARRARVTSKDFGPPPVQNALQSNRMNPPGISMLYLASTANTALDEARVANACVGQWEVERPLRILDLRYLPNVPGLFANAGRGYTLALRFLHRFANEIMSPVERDQRVHIDYLPSQVITEFIRDYNFEGGKVDGIAYGSTVNSIGWNVALFATPIDLGLEAPDWRRTPAPWLSFVKSVRKNR